MLESSKKTKIISWEEGWDFIQKGITKLKNIVEGTTDLRFSSDEYMQLYTTVFEMCKPESPDAELLSQKLYDKYRETFEQYITSTVLPSLREEQDEFFLKEFVKRWSNHKVMLYWLSRFFHYLERYFIRRRSLPGLKEVSITCFHSMVYQELNAQVKDAAILLIERDREGEQIDRDLLKNILNIFVEIGQGSMKYYKNDYEAYLLKDTSLYYSRKASKWIQDYLCPEYMLKAEESLKQEKDRVSNYLHSSSEQKLLEEVQNELLAVYASQLLENEHSGCHALLWDDKVEDLSRMYRLFSQVPHGLELVSQIFKQYVTGEGTILVKQADVVSNKKVLIAKVMELQSKNLGYVRELLSKPSLVPQSKLLCGLGLLENLQWHVKWQDLFFQALEEAFGEFYKEGVAGSLSSDLLATF